MKKLLLLLFVLPFFFACTDDSSSSSEPEPTPAVKPACGNGIQEEGETWANCPQDVEPSCGNGIKEGDEYCDGEAWCNRTCDGMTGCRVDSDCSEGQYCNSANECVTHYGVEGDRCPCANGYYCEDGLCVKEKLPDDSTCVKDDDCRSGLCKEHKCSSN